MSPIAVLALVSVLALLAVVVFGAVVVGIHSESHHGEMPTGPHRPLAAMVRRFLGVYVSKPTNANENPADREECLTGPSADWWNKGGSPR